MNSYFGDEPTHPGVVPMDLGEVLGELGSETSGDERWALELIADELDDSIPVLSVSEARVPERDIEQQHLESLEPIAASGEPDDFPASSSATPPVLEVTMELQDLDIEDAWALELLDPEDQLSVCKALLEKPQQPSR